MVDEWWYKKRNISIVVDNDSWITPFAQTLFDLISKNGDNVKFCRDYDDVLDGGIAFFLGCVKICPVSLLERNCVNLVIHESDLPQGKGFAPVTWQIIEGKNTIPICLLEAREGVDSGDVYFRSELKFEGHELCDEIRKAQGEKSLELCLQFLNNNELPRGEMQKGADSFYPRRRALDSRLDIDKTIREQFLLLRTVDSRRYPAFFEVNGQKYYIKIEKG